MRNGQGVYTPHAHPPMSVGVPRQPPLPCTLTRISALLGAHVRAPGHLPLTAPPLLPV